MSVESEDYLDRFETSGTDEFTITFPVQYDAGGNAKDIKVYYRNSAGLEDDITDDCTIAGLVVTTPSAYAATTPASIVTLLRYPDLKQLSTYTSGTKFPASQFQADIDRMMFVAQRLDSEISRGLRTPVTDGDADLTLPTIEARANTVLGFDAVGVPIASAGIPSTPATAFMATLLDDEDVATAQTTLEVYSKTEIDALSVKLTGAQSIADVKTFTSIPVLPASNPTSANQASRKAYVDGFIPQMASAWVNFNGTGTVSIRDDYNVDSITDNGTGDYTVNIDVDLADANYATVVTTGQNNVYGCAVTRATGSVVIDTLTGTGGAAFDTDSISVVIIGGR